MTLKFSAVVSRFFSIFMLRFGVITRLEIFLTNRSKLLQNARFLNSLDIFHSSKHSLWNSISQRVKLVVLFLTSYCFFYDFKNFFLNTSKFCKKFLNRFLLRFGLTFSMMTSQKNWYSIRTRKCLRYLVPS